MKSPSFDLFLFIIVVVVILESSNIAHCWCQDCVDESYILVWIIPNCDYPIGSVAVIQSFQRLNLQTSS